MSAGPRLLLFYARVDALGDGLIRLPALRAARTAFPDARIVYGTARETTLATVLRRYAADLVDDFRSGSTLPGLIADLDPPARHTAVVDFRSIAGWLVAARLRLLTRRIRYEANFPGFALSPVARGIEFRPAHNAWRYHRMVERLADRPLPFDHRIEPSRASTELVRRVFGHRARPLALLAGNAARHKALSADQLAPVALEMLQRGYDVVHVHSPGAGATGTELRACVAELQGIGPEADIEGVPLLDVVAALGATADVFIGPEGGLAHLMAALATPMVIVNHGARVERWRPLSALVEIVDVRSESPTGRTAELPAAAILRAVDRLAAARHRDHPVDPSGARRAGSRGTSRHDVVAEQG